MDELGFGKQVNKFKKKKFKMDYVLRQNLVFRLFLEIFLWIVCASNYLVSLTDFGTRVCQTQLWAGKQTL